LHCPVRFCYIADVGQKLDCEQEIGRRIRLRDLHVLLTVSQHGSMARAAAQLGLSQPAVSGVIAELERTLGVPLFERSTRGVKPTMYAQAMLDRSVAAFDELKQGIRTLETLADPTGGELWVGCTESATGLMLPPILHQFMQRYPRVVVHVQRLSSPKPDFRDLGDRNLDVIVARTPRTPEKDSELTCIPLSDDRSVVVAGAQSRWARARKVELGELVDEPWVLPPRQCRSHAALMQIFRTRGLRAPQVALLTYSIPLRMSLVASGPYITIFPDSIRSLGAYAGAIQVLPIELPPPPTVLAVITLKNRKLNPVAEHFIEHLRSHATGQFASAD
jgi:DNA-binding transcriptional LysR family regulator